MFSTCQGNTTDTSVLMVPPLRQYLQVFDAGVNVELVPNWYILFGIAVVLLMEKVALGFALFEKKQYFAVLFISLQGAH